MAGTVKPLVARTLVAGRQNSTDGFGHLRTHERDIALQSRTDFLCHAEPDLPLHLWPSPAGHQSQTEKTVRWRCCCACVLSSSLTCLGHLPHNTQYVPRRKFMCTASAVTKPVRSAPAGMTTTLGHLGDHMQSVKRSFSVA